MKKFITLLLVLTGMVSTVGATKHTIYIKAESPSTPDNHYIYIWNVTSGGTASFPGVQVNTLSTISANSNTYYYREIEDSGTFKFILSDGSKQTSDQSKTNSIFIEYTGGDSYTDITGTALADFLCLNGSHNSWHAEESIFTESDGTYTYDLSTTSDVQFRLYKGGWIDNANVKIDAPSGWQTTAGDNLKLVAKNQSYTSYTFTAKKDGDDWKLKIRGKDAYRFTIAGDAAIVNGSDGWTINAANDMDDDDLDGVFRLLVKNVDLTAGHYYFRAYRDGKKDGWQVPSSSNWDLNIESDGKYNIIYTLTPDTYTLNAQAIPATVPATISAVGYATFSSPYALDFTDVTAIKAYLATSTEDGKVMMTKVDGKVKANTGLFLAGETTNIPTTICTTEVTNLLVPTDGTDIYDSGKNRYVFANQDDNPAFYKVTKSLTVAAGKAYLETESPLVAGRLAFVFDDDDVTAINAVKQEVKANGEYYNLAGQRVAQPTKGLYIVNGKKVVIK